MDQKVEEAMIGKMILKFHNSQISKPIQAVGSHVKHVGSTPFRSIIIQIGAKNETFWQALPQLVKIVSEGASTNLALF